MIAENLKAVEPVHDPSNDWVYTGYHQTLIADMKSALREGWRPRRPHH